MMHWLKHGVIYNPDGSLWWAKKYASVPTPVWIRDDLLRVYITCRDENNIGRVGYIDLDPSNPICVVNKSTTPVLDIGIPGTFDDNGVMCTTIVKMLDGTLFMYYVGFELCHRIRYRLLTGLAISNDMGETFKRYQPTPILERSPEELFFRGGPYTLRDGDIFKMWYVAGSSWEYIDGKAMAVYDLRYIESHDGINWPTSGIVVLKIDDVNEHGFGRPFVVKTDKGYKMYYSIRQKSPRQYCLGYAESSNGLEFIRKDSELNLHKSSTGWDSEAIEYAAEINVAGKTWLLYNGNDFGATGVGIAELITENP